MDEEIFDMEGGWQGDGTGITNNDDDLDDDWDIDSEEEREKEKQKEEERKKALSIKEKIRQKEAAEKAAREARIAELTREKTPAEIEKEQVDAQLAIAAQQLGFDVGPDEDIMASAPASTTKSSHLTPDSSSIDEFVPKSKKDFEKLADMITDRVYQFENEDEFKQFLEKLVKSISEKATPDQYETVMSLGKTISQIGNRKQQEWKKMNRKGKTKQNLKPGLSKGGQQVENFENTYEDYDDFM